MRSLKHRWHDLTGITGLETAIVLIAFVVASAGLAFAVLSTGLFTSEKAKETLHAALSETRGTLELRASVVITASTTGIAGEVSNIAFQVGGAAGGAPMDLTPGQIIIKYNDPTQSKLFDSSSGFTVTPMGDADSDMILELDELFEINLMNLDIAGPGRNRLDNILSTNGTFSLEVISPRGAALFIERTTPAFLETSTSLH